MSPACQHNAPSLSQNAKTMIRFCRSHVLSPASQYGSRFRPYLIQRLFSSPGNGVGNESGLYFSILITRNEMSSPKLIVDPDPAIRGACFVVTSDSHPHVLPMYAPGLRTD